MILHSSIVTSHPVLQGLVLEASSWLEYFQASNCMAGTFALDTGAWTSRNVPLSSNLLIYRVELLFTGLEKCLAFFF